MVEPQEIADWFNVPLHLIADAPRQRFWRLRRWWRLRKRRAERRKR